MILLFERDTIAVDVHLTAIDEKNTYTSFIRDEKKNQYIIPINIESAKRILKDRFTSEGYTEKT